VRRHEAERKTAPVMDASERREEIHEPSAIEVIAEQGSRIDAMRGDVMDRVRLRDTWPPRHPPTITRPRRVRYRPNDVTKVPGTRAWHLPDA